MTTDTRLTLPAGESVVGEASYAVGKTIVNNSWYFAVAGEKVKRGATLAKTMLGRPVLIGRDDGGQVFAITNICPHQGVALSCGAFDGRRIECPFHGWKFDTSGVCTEIPALMPDQCMNLPGIKTGNYPCREVHGNIWVYFGEPTANLPEVPSYKVLDELIFDKTTVSLQLPIHMDYAAAALIDTAHVPYVHKSWWWRSKRAPEDKVKHYVPDGTGWTMVKHKPSKHSIYKLIGDYVEDEISFCLPAARREYISFNNRIVLAGMSTLTPVDETHCELNHTTYCTIPGLLPIFAPIVNAFVREFLGQDQTIAKMQAEGLKYNPKLIMTIRDSGTPGAWYFLLKREWNEATAEGRPFANPIKESILRWRT
ncbi:MAG TPA: aromatic ring-hydroxylating dioxygenase subunit alpha [Candidatus Obscuribacterales bacterium]